MAQKLKFTKISEAPKNNKVFIHLMYAGGDADTEHPEKYEVKGVTFDQKDGDVIQKEIENYILLKQILDCNSSKFCERYDEVQKLYGEEMADMFDNVPNDPQNDYQNKCYLDDMMIVAYDEKGAKYEANVNLYTK